MRRFLGSHLLWFALIVLSLPGAAFAQVGIAITIAPPPLPVYSQPLCPGEGYIWVPGYWAYDPNYNDYYWVPGTWVLAPEAGFLWTPPWWGWEGNGFIFHAGYWGSQVGFYGGIDYGFGYFGHGYEGGRWNHGAFYYNRAVNNVNVTNIHNVYNVTVNNVTVNRVSYNGGNGGVEARPTPAEEAAARERHLPPVAAQTQHIEAARNNPQLRASANKGKPPIAATPRPGTFNGGGVVHASGAGGPYRPPTNHGPAKEKARGPAPRPNEAARPIETTHPTEAARPNEAARPESSISHPPNNVPRPSPTIHARNVPPHPAPPPPNTGNAEKDRQVQQRQEQLNAQQQREHEQLQQQQEQDHQRTSQQKASGAHIQQMERQHQQQTTQMEQRHEQQQQQISRQAAPPPHAQAKPAPAPHAEAKPGPEPH